MNKKYIVTKANPLIIANYNLSLQEQKIILILASMVQPDDDEFHEYKFKIKDILEILGIQDQSKYVELPKITKELMKKVFEIREGDDILQLAWVSSARYKTKEGLLILKFSSDLRPYMLHLKKLYTSYRLENILSLKSKYSLRIYEILKSNQFKKTWEVELKELKKILAITEKSYELYSNLKMKVVLKAQKELKEKTDISFNFVEIKTGRKVTSIKFYIHSNKKITSNDEIAATKAPLKQITGQIDFETQELINKVKQIIKEQLSDEEIHKLLKVAENDIHKIQVAYKIAEQNTRPIDNLYTFLESAIENNYKLPVRKENVKKSKFANFQEREDLDWDKIEKLGRKNIEKELEK